MPVQTIVMVASPTVMELVYKILGQCTDLDVYGEEELRARMAYVRRCAECIVAIAKPDYEAIAREQQDPRSLK